jgi:hypothetical protein
MNLEEHEKFILRVLAFALTALVSTIAIIIVAINIIHYSLV